MSKLEARQIQREDCGCYKVIDWKTNDTDPPTYQSYAQKFKCKEHFNA